MTALPATLTLERLGWNEFFAGQLSADERRDALPGRVFAVQRNSVTVVGEGDSVEATLGGRWFQLDAEARPTIGDWLLLGRDNHSINRLLERKSLLKRVAVGREREVQLLAANVDTMFLVSACNEEFNPSRLERYLALALHAGVEPVVVLTKADLAAEAESFRARARTLKDSLEVELVDARDPESLAGIRLRCRLGRTVALLGSSGVGKSTLVNTLSGAQIQLTRESRQDDDKGRHTTTGRSLHMLHDGGLLVDNPGMRELSLADVDLPGGRLFDDIESLARHCRFRNCRHEAEPGCAVRAALDSGDLEARRFDSYRKLASEQLQRKQQRPPKPAHSRSRR